MSWWMDPLNWPMKTLQEVQWPVEITWYWRRSRNGHMLKARRIIAKNLYMHTLLTMEEWGLLTIDRTDDEVWRAFPKQWSDYEI